MKLLRMAIVVPKPVGLQRPLHFPYLANDRTGMHIEVLKHYVAPTSERRFVVGAIAALSEPLKLTDAGLIQVADATRLAAEQMLESAADVFAVMEGVGREVVSPTPCIALMPESESETELLRAANGIEAPRRTAVSVKSRVDDALMPQLLDRLDGVASLAEANSASSRIGEFHELLRVFERAFAVNGSSLFGPLTKFLEGADRLGYTKGEVQGFVKEARNASSHLEAWKQRDFYLDARSRVTIDRMRQAAYEVLYNKKLWHNPAPARRDVWWPTAGTSAPGTPFVVEGEGASAQFIVLDEYAAFPLDTADTESHVPEGWLSWPPGDDVAGFAVQMRPKRG